MSEPTDAKSDRSSDKPKKHAVRPETAVTSRQQVQMGERLVAYTATVGTVNLRNAKDDDTASIFFVSYVADAEDGENRPITFCFNGGPGSSSVWLHFGAFGPTRVDIPDGVAVPPPPYSLVDNEHGLLDVTDLVFIDPVGTGFSRPQGEADGKDFHGMKEDTDSVVAFIEKWISRNHRWNSAKYLAGESYGTTRAAALAPALQRRGIALNGLILLSLALDFSTIMFEPGNILPYAMYLPTYAAVARYHGRLDDEDTDLDELMASARDYAVGGLTPALMRGQSITEDERHEISLELARYTGLSADHIRLRNLKMEYMHFARKVLGPGTDTVGRLDGRYVGPDPQHAESATRDPSMDAPWAAYASAANHHLRAVLGWEGDDNYEVLSFEVNQAWAWTRDKRFGYPNTARDLRDAMISNPHLKVLVANGIYDLATPFFAAEYTINQMDLPGQLRENITLTYYLAGHMMYFHPPSLAKLKADVAALFR